MEGSEQREGPGPLESKDVSEPKVLYHYTSTEGMYGIISDGCLWATDASYLKDASELINGLELVDEILNVVDTTTTEWLEPTREFVRGTSKAIKAVFVDELYAYIVSFSTEADLLSQWRAYSGPKGSVGYALGFDRSLLDRQTEQCETPFDLEAVAYGIEQQRHAIILASANSQIKTLDEIVSIAAELQDNEPTLALQSRTREVWRQLIIDVGKTVARFKDGYFSEEREWRLIGCEDRTSKRSNVEFRTSELGLTPYIRFPIRQEQGTNSPLVEVRVGPSPDPDRAVDAVRRLLDAKGYDCGAISVILSRNSERPV